MQSLGVALEGGGTYADAALVRLGGRHLPSDPTQIVKPIFARPCKLRGVGNEREWLTDLLVAYEKCVRRATGKTSYAYRGTRPDGATEKKFLTAARMLQIDEIAPESWCASSIDQFTSMAGVRHVPRPVWVWAPTRLREGSLSRQWFEERRAEYQQPRQLWPEGLRELHRDWTTMMSELRTTRPTTRDALLAIVDAYFPRDAFDRRLQSCRAAASRLERSQV